MRGVFTTLQNGHLLCNCKTNNGQAGVVFLIDKKWNDHTVRVNSIRPRVAEFVMCITKCYKINLRKTGIHFGINSIDNLI